MSQRFQFLCVLVCVHACVCEIQSPLINLTKCITQYYLIYRTDSPVQTISPVYYCNATMDISTTDKLIELITR